MTVPVIEPCIPVNQQKRGILRNMSDYNYNSDYSSNSNIYTTTVSTMSKSYFNEVPLWTVDDVSAWVLRHGFGQAAASAFASAGVDGDLLLQLDEPSLRQDLGMTNGIHRKRFLRELNTLKKEADYSSRDAHNLAAFLANNIGPEYRAHTYALLRHDLSVGLMQRLNAGDLHDMLKEAGIASTIHRHRIIEAAHELCNAEDSCSDYYSQDSVGGADVVDVFVSYTKNHGSAELASLIRMQLQLRGLSVCAAEADDLASESDAVLNYVREAKSFVMVLSSGSLDDCLGSGSEPKSPLHKEILAALDSGSQIIPVLDNFLLPEPEELPEDLRALCYFNGVRWVHDYQEACIDKLERFIRGEEKSVRSQSLPLLGGRSPPHSGRATPTRQLVHTPILARKQRCRNVSVDSAVVTA